MKRVGWTAGWVVALVTLIGLPRAGLSQEPEGKARDVLTRHCHGCHGAEGRNEGGFNTVTDLAELVASGRVVAGQPDRSPLLKRIERGDMPPEFDVDDTRDEAPALPRLTAEEIATVRGWIAAGAPVAPRIEPRTRTFLGDVRILGLVLSDLKRIPERERRFARYFSIAHLHNAGYSEERLETYRLGLSKLVNSLSWGRRVHRPEPIDPDRTIIRIDLRDYQWDDGVWDTLVAAYPYGVHLGSQTERELEGLSGEAQLVVRADWFVHAASRPPLYHQVLRLPDTLRELEEKLNVNPEQNIDQEQVARAGFVQSGVSRNNRVIERHESSYGASWKSYDFAGNGGTKNIFANPLGPGGGPFAFQHDGGEVIFDLPNGLHGYFLADAAGKRLVRGPTEIVRDEKQADAAVVNGISCMSCHSLGLIPKQDQIRAVVNRGRSFPAETVERIEGLYPPVEDFLALLDDDNERFRAAVVATGSPLSRTEPVYALALQFEKDLDLTLAAAEAGVSPVELRNLMAREPELSQALGPLLVGSPIKRDAFIAAFPLIARARRLELRTATSLVRGAAGAPGNHPPGPPPGLPAPSNPAPHPLIRFEPQRGPTGPPRTDGKWTILFSGRDPRAWNRGPMGSTDAVPLDRAPQGTSFLRLRRLDTRESLVIPIRSDLLDRARPSNEDPSPAARWCGSNQLEWGGFHLGIAEGPRISGFDRETGPGTMAVQVEGTDFFRGSGFGHIAHGDAATQHFGWRGQPIPPTDFEIAVTPGPLDPEEQAALLPSLAFPATTAANATGSRGAFQGSAPPGGVLVGVRVSLVNTFGGNKIGSIRPLFRVAGELVEGERYGNPGGTEATVLARSGYAVGGMRLNRGLLVDGFALIFMQQRGATLDPSTRYESPFIGDPKGGQPGQAETDGRPLIGLFGNATPREVLDLGLIARE